MATTLTPNMSLPVPGVGTEAGPDYATDINNCLSIVDGHDHTPGSGVQITPSAMDINADLLLNENNLTTARSLRFTAQPSAINQATDLGCIYEAGIDLYYNDGAGNQIRITQSGAVAGTPGSISNLVSPASASYSSGSKTFTWQSDALTPANMDAGSIIIRNVLASSEGVTVSVPSPLAASYTLTLPTTPPASTLPVSMSSSGALSAAQITLVQLVAAVQASLNPSGSIITYGGAAAPTGYLLCDGTAVSRSTYASLFTAIGSAYGSGDGSTTFNLPDFRGRFLRMVDGAAGRDPDASSRTAMSTGGNTGNNVGSVQLDAFEAHNHGVTHTSNFSTATPGSSNILRDVSTLNEIDFAQGGNETRPLNAYVNFCIKT